MVEMWAQLNRLFSVPKGFGKFYPKGASKKTKKKGLSSGGGNGGGGWGPGGSGGKPEIPDGVRLPFAVAGVGMMYFMFSALRRDHRHGK